MSLRPYLGVTAQSSDSMTGLGFFTNFILYLFFYLGFFDLYF